MASYRYERNISPEDLVPEKTRELTPAEARANWWHYHWYYVVLIAAAVDDVNGDGKVKVNVKSIWLALDYDGQDSSLRKLMESSEDKLNSDFYLCESMIFIVDDPAAMEQRYGCFRLLDGTDPQEGDSLSVSDFAVLLDDTALAGVQSKSGAEWYVARRLSEGVEEESLTTGDALWEKLI